jgi:hypothetical protein
MLIFDYSNLFLCVAFIKRLFYLAPFDIKCTYIQCINECVHFYTAMQVQSLQNWKNEVLSTQTLQGQTTGLGKPAAEEEDDSSYNYSQEIQVTLNSATEGGRGGRGASASGTHWPRPQLEKTCEDLRLQVTQLQEALESVSSIVFQTPRSRS